tara:strand:+ start:424 stop:1257 length:834 start_codon:yes stop_codon:yes gene_type:complete
MSLEKIKELQGEIALFEKVKKSLEAKRETIQMHEEEALMEHYKQMFSGALMEGDEVQKGYRGFIVKRRDPDAKYSREIIGISFTSSNWKRDDPDQIETSFYSTSDNGEFELKRMLTLGRIAMVILDFKDDIIAGHTQILDNYKPSRVELFKTINKNDMCIDECEKEISDIREQEIRSMLNNGVIEFDVKEPSSRNPRLEVRYNWDIRDIKNLEILSKTPSGLSAKIKVTRISNVWKEDAINETEIREYEDTFEKVRMSNIENFVFGNREFIKNTLLD